MDYTSSTMRSSAGANNTSGTMGEYSSSSSSSSSFNNGIQSSSHSFLKKKYRVGTCHHSSINYDSSERAFHADDIPAKARQAKIDVTITMKEQHKNRWNNQTSLNRPIMERRSTEIIAFDPTEYQYNYRAEVLPKARPIVRNVFGKITSFVLDTHFHRTQEMPVHPELISSDSSTSASIPTKTRWEISTNLTEKDKANNLHNMTTKALQSTRRINATLRARSPSPLPSLMDRENHRMDTLRNNRTNAYRVHSEESLINIQQHQLGWTANIRNAALLKEAYVPAHSVTIPPPKNVSEVEYIELMNSIKDQHNKTLAQTHRSNVTIQYKHTGVYTEATDEASLRIYRSTGSNMDDDSLDSYYANESNTNDGTTEIKKKKIVKQWSCCASTDSNARGCVVVKQNSDRWCYG